MTRGNSKEPSVVIQLGGDEDAEMERFEKASASTRMFLCLTRSIQAQKICLLILGVSLILLVQLIHLVHPPDLLASGSGKELLAAARHWSEAADQLVNITRKLTQ